MRKTMLGAAVVLLALQGCSAAGDTPVAGPAVPSPVASGAPPAGPSATAEEAVSGFGDAPPPAGALDGKRQVFFLPRLDDIALPDSVLAVTASGRIQVTDDYLDRALFVPVPKGGGAPERLIKTGTLRTGGEPFCLQVRAAGGSPSTVVTAACDARNPSQLFTFEPSGTDDEGRTTYAVRNRDAFLQWHPQGTLGLVAEALGASSLETTFTLHDQGAAALPRND